MPTIAKIRLDFQRILTGTRALYNFCLTPPFAIHTEPGVEAAFLRLFKGWEGLLEETFIAYMCRRLAHDGQVVACHVFAPNDEVARALLYQQRAYIEWTRPDDVRERAECYFTDGSRIETALRPVMGELRQMTIVRNAIAHSSPISAKKFYELMTKTFGGQPAITRPAQFLLRPNPADPTTTMFDRFATVLEFSSLAMTG